MAEGADRTAAGDGPRRPPLRATYRVQMNAEFTLADARRIVPYLARLGVSHLYSSPILKARPGSTHGYDVADPTVVNPELGTDDDRRALARALAEHGMAMLLDIVPNHMGIGPANPYWEDVLTFGRASRYAAWFDIDWDAPDESLKGRVLLPVLGDRAEAVLARGELRVVEAEGRFRVAYYEHSFPLDPATVAPVREWLARGEPLERFGAGEEGVARLRRLLEAQHYRLVLWRRASNEINYRRFFDINELAALHMEDEPVFEAVHATVLGWLAAGELDGLRIDHVDGLRGPRRYLERLRARVGEGRPLLVEKILSPGERLRREWPVDGTTGYEFLNDLEAVFIDPAGYAEIERGYRALVGAREGALDFHAIARESKRRILRESLAADVQRLARLAVPVVRSDPEFTLSERRGLVEPIRELIVALPVYRTYVNERGHTAEDRALVDQAAAEARRNVRTPYLVDILRRALLYEPMPDDQAALRRARLRFVTRFQQTSGPATAKGVEDTALYRFVPLVSRNEVGGEPDRPLEEAVATLHRGNAERARDWPRALLATNTHDTKRSADLRARLDVLSEIPGEWLAAVERWRRINAPRRGRAGGRPVPEPRTEYLVYQTLVGVWPLLPPDGRAEELPASERLETLAERVRQYVEKAIREAKVFTSWTDPDEAYERGVLGFVDALLAPDDAEARRWREAELAPLVARVGRPGLWTSLARLAVHLTAPGTPDLYQGDELWHFALVDPDNRRAVDYALRERLLCEVERMAGDPAALAELVARPEDGRIKLFLTRALLHARHDHAAAFLGGAYQPLEARGARAAHVVAFARGTGETTAITVAPRLVLSLAGDARPPVGAPVWGDTVLEVPGALAGRRWRCLLGGHAIEPAGDGTVELASVLDRLPVALLMPE